MTIAYLIIAVALGLAQLVIRSKHLSNIVSAAAQVLQLCFTAYAVMNYGATEFDYFRFDGLSVVFVLTLAAVSLAASVHSVEYLSGSNLASENRIRAQYRGAMQMLTMALTMAYLSVHIALTWVFVEVTTLSAAALIFYRRNSGSIEATWKYVFACSVSLVFVYVGILFFSIAMGVNAEEGLTIDNISAHVTELNSFWLKMAFIFIFVGYTAKASLVPMFTAGIDAKDKAPTPAAGMMSSVLMNAGFIGFYRIYAIVAHTDVKHWADNVLLITGLISILVAAVYLVKVDNVKRLFAYSSVEHMGVVVLGIAMGGIGLYAAVLHLVLHSLVKSAIFLHVGQLYRVYGSKMISCMGKYFNTSGVGGTFLIIAMLCITAMPPSGMFMTELMVFRSMIDADAWMVLILTMILLTIIVWAIGRDMFAILFLHAPSSDSKRPISVKAPTYEIVMQFALLAACIWLGYATPNYVAELINSAVALVG